MIENNPFHVYSEYVEELPVSGALAEMTFAEIIAILERGPVGEGKPLHDLEDPSRQLDIVQADQNRFLDGHAFGALIVEGSVFLNSRSNSSIEAFLEWCALAKTPSRVSKHRRFSISTDRAFEYIEILGRLGMEFGREAVDEAVETYVRNRIAIEEAERAYQDALLANEKLIMETAKASPHIASMIATGWVCSGIFDDLDEKERDPVAYDEGRMERWDAGYGGEPEASIGLIAEFLHREIQTGKAGQNRMKDDIRNIYKIRKIRRTIDPVTDYKVMSRGGAFELMVHGWRRMADRFGAEMTISQFLKVMNVPAPRTNCYGEVIDDG